MTAELELIDKIDKLIEQYDQMLSGILTQRSELVMKRARVAELIALQMAAFDSKEH